LAFHLALARLRRNGVFVRTKSLLDKVRVLRHVVFDKTGTVTFGGMRARALDLIPADALPVLASLAASSNHPVSRAVFASLERAPVVECLRVVAHVGQGLTTEYLGSQWCFGSRAFAQLEEHHGEYRDCVLTRDGKLLVAFELEEDFRSGAAAEIAALAARGLQVHLMSG